MDNAAFLQALAAIENPLRFASRNQFENLQRVRDLENTLARAAGRARESAPSPALAKELDAFLSLLPAPNEALGARVQGFQKCVEQLTGIRRLAENTGSPQAIAQPTPLAKPRIESAPKPKAKAKPKTKAPPVPSKKSVEAKPKKEPVKRAKPSQDLSAVGPSTPVQFVKGVGPKTAQAFAFRNIDTIEDLLRFLPRRYENRQTGTAISGLEDGANATVEGEVITKDFRRMRGRRTLDVVIGDETGHLYLKWFRVPGGSFIERFKKGVMIQASGSVARYRGKLQIVHPETRVLDAASPIVPEGHDGTIIPGYLEVEGVRPATLRGIIERVLPVTDRMDDRLPAALRERHHFEALGQCLWNLHQPPSDISVDALRDMDTLWHRRLIYEELLMLQLVVLRRKAEASGDPGIAFEPGVKGADVAKKAFAFEFTQAQSRSLAEIESDLLTASPMNRLLQGDVGSGKTAVALTAAMLAAKAGYQTALMAPTELLAEQHARTALKVLPELGVRVGILTGKLSAAERRRILEELELGMVDMVVGTHALIQGSVRFKRLGLGIVDEQHRFGVMQRARFLEQGMESTGAVPHMLVMTATPIPRTLALTVYGDLDVSIIDQLPPGRTPVRTKKFREAQREHVYKEVIEAVAAGQQAYVVLPLVEESDKEGMENIRDATSTHDELQHGLLHHLKLGLLHGKMGTDEKDRVMRAFSAGQLDVLVATTVIEVGIDVPNASVMVIEHAERFGLSQLHQLRGRVGRGAAESSCLLIARSTQSEDAWRRLAIMEETTDGFKIAEEDLEIRGPGDFVGTRQSGLPVLSIANLARDQKILLLARDDAREILERDPDLLDDDHRGVRASLDAVWQDRLSLAKIG